MQEAVQNTIERGQDTSPACPPASEPEHDPFPMDVKLNARAPAPEPAAAATTWSAALPIRSRTLPPLSVEDDGSRWDGESPMHGHVTSPAPVRSEVVMQVERHPSLPRFMRSTQATDRRVHAPRVRPSPRGLKVTEEEEERDDEPHAPRRRVVIVPSRKQRLLQLRRQAEATASTAELDISASGSREQDSDDSLRDRGDSCVVPLPGSFPGIQLLPLQQQHRVSQPQLMRLHSERALPGFRLLQPGGIVAPQSLRRVPSVLHHPSAATPSPSLWLLSSGGGTHEQLPSQVYESTDDGLPWEAQGH